MRIPRLSIVLLLSASLVGEAGSQSFYYRFGNDRPDPSMGGTGNPGGTPTPGGNGGTGGETPVPRVALDSASNPTGSYVAGGPPPALNLSVTGGRPPVTVAAVGSVPDGLTFDAASRTLVGAMRKAGTYSFSFMATDAGGTTSSTPTYVVTVAPPQAMALGVTPEPVSEVAYGQATDHVVSVSGGMAPISIGLSGAVPPGIAMTSDANRYGGTFQQPGTYTYTVVSSDAFDPTNYASRTFTTTVHPLLTATPSTTPPAEAFVGQPIAPFSVAVSGGKAPYSYSSQGLPAGLSFEGGTLSGAPQSPGTASYSLVVRDSANPPQTATMGVYSLSVTAAPLAISAPSPALPSWGTTGVAIAAVSAPATGGRGPYVYQIGENWPTGLQYVNGSLTGTPTVAGTFSTTLKVVDADERRAEIPFVIDVAPPLANTFNAYLGGTEGVAYSFVPTTTGGTAPVTWTQAGTLPPGITWDGAKLSGTPSAGGTYPGIRLISKDARGRTAATESSITVSSLPSASNATLVGVAVTGNASYTGWLNGAQTTSASDYLTIARGAIPTTANNAIPANRNGTVTYRYSTPVKSTKLYVGMTNFRSYDGKISVSSSADGVTFGAPVTVSLTSATVAQTVQASDGWFGGSRVVVDTPIPQISGSYLRITVDTVPGAIPLYIQAGGFR